MYKTLWNSISKHTKKSSTAAIFLSILAGSWTVIGLLIGALICPLLQNATILVKTTVILCSGGYAGLIFGFFGGIFYIYRGAVKNPHTANTFLQIQHN